MTGLMQDSGLQLERTLLSWRRTSLAFAVGSAAFIRLGTPDLGTVAVLMGAFGIVGASWTYIRASCQFARVSAGEHKIVEAGIVGGRSMLIIVLALIFVSFAIFVALLVGALAFD